MLVFAALRRRSSSPSPQHPMPGPALASTEHCSFDRRNSLSADPASAPCAACQGGQGPPGPSMPGSKPGTQPARLAGSYGPPLGSSFGWNDDGLWAAMGQAGLENLWASLGRRLIPRRHSIYTCVPEPRAEARHVAYVNMSARSHFLPWARGWAGSLPRKPCLWPGFEPQTLSRVRSRSS